MKSITREWRADMDLKTAREILDDEYLTPSAAFHCHQCIEKSFKAVLAECCGGTPRIHNLLKLLELVKKYFTDISEESISYINEIYIDTRYPSDFGLLPNGTPSKELAKELYETAETVYGKTVSYLNKMYG